MKNKPLVAVIYGSDSDLPVMQEALDILDRFDVAYETTIVSAHRTPQKLFSYSKEAHERGLKVIIAGAGGAAHLPGMVASITPLPVIGVPVKSKSMSGLDSLYSIVQMPPGIPVATMAINGAQNAGILATSILGSHDEKYLQKVIDFKKNLNDIVETKCESIKSKGTKKYIAENLK
ncbi:MAG: 5-(carboxyamino)imidazole ribonucleotide mutase [Firmicutes bacterium]|nr:5-(carboxyamino)imidazole ribonucleotide mutase [Bacillota bacterium]MCL2255488.1 5-(carboxyamino)imidazole ribonucleotide mutase [Bacillota bacterium]